MHYRIICLSLALFIAPLVCSSDVVFNELCYDPLDIGEEGGALREFLELYNPGPDTVDLSGYAFTDGVAYTFPDGTEMAPDSYLVVVRVPSLDMWRNRSYPVLGPYEGKLSNGGERVVLERPDGTVVEEFKYNDDFPWPMGADGYGPSMERIAWDLPTDDFHTWRASLNDNGTPGAQNSVTGTPSRPTLSAYDLIPTHPTSSDDVKVQIGLDTPEIIQAAYLHWEINDNAPVKGIVNFDDPWHMWKGRTAPSTGLEWTEPDYNDSSWTSADGGFGYGDLDVVNTELSDMRGNYSTVYLRHTFTVNDPESLGLLSLSIFYDDSFICYINGVETARSNAPYPYTHESTSTGSHESSESETFTLGNASSLLHEGDNVIALVGFNITLGNSTDFVLAATLLSSAQSGGGRRIPLAFASEWVGGATFQATVPAQSNQTLVRYNVEVELTSGETLLLPHEAERRPFESYFVYDNDIPSELPILWLFTDQTTHLPASPGAYSGVAVKPVGDEPVQVYDGATITSARNGHKVKFLKGEEFRGDRTINLSLESPREGTTAGGQSPHVEHISYQLFKDFGVLTPRCDWYRVVEGGEHSQRIAVQQPNERFIEMNGRDPDGNIYKVAYNEPGGYSKKNNLDEGDDDYRELFQHVNKNNTSTLTEDLRAYLDIEEVMGYEVATFLLSHWDGIKNNIFLYHHPEEPFKWEIIPWDVDKTFGYTDQDPMYYEMPIDFFQTLNAPGSSDLTGRHLDGPITRPFHMDAELNQEFVNRVAQALDGLFSQERVGGAIDEAETLLLADLDEIEQYTGRTNNSRRNQITTSYDTMRTFLTYRHQFLRTQLPTDFTVARSVPVMEFHTGETVSGIQIEVNALGGKTIAATVVERIPEQFTATNVQTSLGTIQVMDSAITWTLENLSSEAVLTYDLLTPIENPPMHATLSGSITVGDTEYSIGDVELEYMPDNMYALGPDWEFNEGGDWTIVDGILTCFSESSADPKHAWVNKDFGTNEYTVKADARMMEWSDGDLARAGIAVCVDPDGQNQALNLLFHEDNNSVDMLYDLIDWGTNGDYAWEVGEWYTMVLSVEGSLLEGQFSRTGSNEAPLMMTWENPTFASRVPGFPGLTGSTMEGLTAQFDNFEVSVDGDVVFFDDFNRATFISGWELY